MSGTFENLSHSRRYLISRERGEVGADRNANQRKKATGEGNGAPGSQYPHGGCLALSNSPTGAPRYRYTYCLPHGLHPAKLLATTNNLIPRISSTRLPDHWPSPYPPLHSAGKGPSERGESTGVSWRCCPHDSARRMNLGPLRHLH